MTLAGWYPLVLSRDIAAGTSAGVRVAGQEFVVWRDTGGNAHIWEDRCPHRGMKLSFGFVRGDYIACLYHGWRYDGRGQCTYIPAHPDLEVPETIKVPRYQVAEVAGIIWGCFEEETGTAPPAPDLAEITPIRSVFADCPEASLIEQIALTPCGDDLPVITGSDDHIVRVRIGDVELLAAGVATADIEAALHLVAVGSLPPDQQARLALWAVMLRRGGEAKPAWKSAEIAA